MKTYKVVLEFNLKINSDKNREELINILNNNLDYNFSNEDNEKSFKIVDVERTYLEIK